MTPIITIIIEINVARKDLKKKKKINDVIESAATINMPISSIIVFAFSVLMYGIPEVRRSTLVSASNFSISGIRILSTKSFLAFVFTIFLSK